MGIRKGPAQVCFPGTFYIHSLSAYKIYFRRGAGSGKHTAHLVIIDPGMPGKYAFLLTGF
jgi:hypothetical protein